MSSYDICFKRLQKEFRDIQKNPIENIKAAPNEENILEWHYIIIGAEGTPYANGYYHGMLKFRRDYPFSPPAVIMITPNGRFRENTRICLSMSDYHPELWNTSWYVSTILVGLQSFMYETTDTVGSIVTSDATKISLAAKSLSFNCKDKMVRELFPEIYELYMKQREEEKESDNTIVEIGPLMITDGIEVTPSSSEYISKPAKSCKDMCTVS